MECRRLKDVRLRAGSAFLLPACLPRKLVFRLFHRTVNRIALYAAFEFAPLLAVRPRGGNVQTITIHGAFQF
jgi:hypothetical protein